MKLEDKVFGEMGLVAPDDSADADVGETEFVARGIDGDHAGELEIPEERWSCEGGDERARSTVDVNGDGMSSLLLILIQAVAHLFDGLIMARVCAAEDDKDADGVFVYKVHRALGVETVVGFDGYGHETAFNVKVTGKFLEGDLSVGAHDDIGARFVDGFAGSLAFVLPDALHGEAAELDCLG